MDSLKAARLNKLFNTIVTGRIPLNESNHLQFLESISTSPEPVGRFHAIVTNPNGLATLQRSLWINISPPFLNNAATKLLQTIKSPSLASTSGGSYLRKVVQAIVDPPIFWDAFVDALKTNQLEPDAQASFAWLLLQLLTLSPEMAKQYAPLANDPSIIGVLSNSTQPEVEVALKKIGRVVAASSPSTIAGALDAPGGRHSNDQCDFRDILILPTADELAFTLNGPSFVRVTALKTRALSPIVSPSISTTSLGCCARICYTRCGMNCRLLLGRSRESTKGSSSRVLLHSICIAKVRMRGRRSACGR